jgi:XTP/dITP diphosphohydrolase
VSRIIVATKNRGKIEEIKALFEGLSFDVFSMEDEGLTGEIEETGKTFEENALIKARKVFDMTGQIAVADDSGLEVDCLGGRPGIYSARFAGENATDGERNRKLLNMMKEVPFDSRTARFVCVIAVVYGKDDYFTVKEVCEGYIAFEEKGSNGFGYDTVFYVPEYNKTMAQLTAEEKNSISHRGKAFGKMKNMKLWSNI